MAEGAVFILCFGILMVVLMARSVFTPIDRSVTPTRNR
jgi:hypothetical protein